MLGAGHLRSPVAGPGGHPLRRGVAPSDRAGTQADQPAHVLPAINIGIDDGQVLYRTVLAQHANEAGRAAGIGNPQPLDRVALSVEGAFEGILTCTDGRKIGIAHFDGIFQRKGNTLGVSALRHKFG